jgi:hypothetical protein
MIVRLLLAAAGAASLVQACAHAQPSDPPKAGEITADPSGPGDEGDEPPMTPASAPPAAGSARPALLAEVNRELRAMKTTAYVHHTHVDEASGTFDYDCSGFFDYALSRAVPEAFAPLQASTPRRPRSSEIVAFLESIPPGSARGRWQRVARVADLTPGDVVSWLKPPDSRSKNTGHTMIVRAAVSPDPDRPGAFVVPVFDSTARPHGAADARAINRGTGLGEGAIVLVTGAAGEPVAFEWSPGGREKETTIVLGHVR